MCKPKGTEPQMISIQKRKFVQKLAQKKFRDTEGMFLVEGVRSVQEAIAAGVHIEVLIAEKSAADAGNLAGLVKNARSAGIEMCILTTQEYGQFSDTVNSQGIIAAVHKPEPQSIESVLASMRTMPAMIVALDAVSEPGNLGAIIRTSDWFGASAVLLGKGCVELHNPKVVRSTMGSIFHLPILEGLDLAAVLPQLREMKWQTFAAEVNASEDIRTIQWPDRTVIVIGNEAHGISAQVSAAAGRHVFIPSFGKAESLNAGVAASVFLSHYALRNHDH
jgi:TrmH family RNA methyltransferase